MERMFPFGFDTPPVCRLGLATRGNTHMEAKDVRHAVDRGVNFLNWCGRADGLSRAVAELGPERDRVVLAWQLKSASAEEAERELHSALRVLKTDTIDFVTFYYLALLDDWRAPTTDERNLLLEHGDRVYYHAGAFPRFSCRQELHSDAAR